VIASTMLAGGWAGAGAGAWVAVAGGWAAVAGACVAVAGGWAAVAGACVAAALSAGNRAPPSATSAAANGARVRSRRVFPRGRAPVDRDREGSGALRKLAESRLIHRSGR
jgi:hypothetical protein